MSPTPGVSDFITCLPHIDPASGSLQYPWWSWHFPWPRWSRFLWYRTNRGYRCRSGSTPALLRIPASRQCWQCVNPIREQGEIKRSYGWKQRSDGLEHADPVGLVMRWMLGCEYKWLLTYWTLRGLPRLQYSTIRRTKRRVHQLVNGKRLNRWWSPCGLGS